MPTIPWRYLKRLILAAMAIGAAGALTPSGAKAADIELYSNSSFAGDVVGFIGDVPDLNAYGFSNRASSIRVRRGAWQVCSEANYRGNCLIVERDVMNMSSLGLNDTITSVRRSTGARGQNPEIIAYTETGYGGTRQTFNSAVPDLQRYGLDNRISSLRVRGGTWEICDGKNFSGDCETVAADVANLSDFELNNRISSFRPTRPVRGALPPGSWSKTCRKPLMRGYRLFAECKDRQGAWQFTQINTRRCTQPISNQNGRLTCGEPTRLPPGSWRNSCQNAELDGWVLGAECLNRNGQYRYSEIDLRSCREPISNQNGYLTCGEGPKLPPGSWQNSCRNYDIAGTILDAECRDRSGRYRYSEIDLRSCREPISNQDGELTCGEGSRLPPGSWNQTCRDADLNGTILSAECLDRTGRYRYSELNLRYCREPVTNQDGYLTCGEIVEEDDGLPPGSWINSCRNYSMNGTVLQAECRNHSGQWRFTVLDTQYCSQPVANLDGVLTCF
ncbi:MAG: CVNH domain-containing protein [Dongiaceae bacterium]